MDKIMKAVPLEDYRIEIQTGSGISGIFDVQPYLNGSAFKELVNESYFPMVRPAYHGIAWPHGRMARISVLTRSFGIFNMLGNAFNFFTSSSSLDKLAPSWINNGNQ